MLPININTEKKRILAAAGHGMSYIKFALKWVWAASLTGVIGGFIGMAFHKSVAVATVIRGMDSRIMWFMPLAGLLIVFIYKISGMLKNKGTDAIIESVRSGEEVPPALAPVIFAATVLTHLVGGSAGREGAALQLGGSIGSMVGRVFAMGKDDMQMIIMCGMSAVFAALFGTPVTAAFFAMEVTSVGTMLYAGLIPCIIAAASAYAITLFYNIPPTHFNISHVPSMSVVSFAQTALLAALCAALSILFCFVLHRVKGLFKNTIKNPYVRILAGSAVILIMTYFAGCYDYNGSGVGVISAAVAGSAKPQAFMLKIIFTAVTLGCGFRGGEIVPTFFIGSTFGCVIAGLIGLEPGFGAAVGMAALFCGVVNCPVASIFLSIELFGGQGILFFAAACAISYMLSGYHGLYGSQKFMYSKFKNKFINIVSK